MRRANLRRGTRSALTTARPRRTVGPPGAGAAGGARRGPVPEPPDRNPPGRTRARHVPSWSRRRGRRAGRDRGPRAGRRGRQCRGHGRQQRRCFPRTSRTSPGSRWTREPGHPRGGRQRQHRRRALPRRRPRTCPFTPGVGVSGVQISSDAGGPGPSRPTRGTRRVTRVGRPPGTTRSHWPRSDGPIGTLPKYFENGMASNGDPGSFRPRARRGRLVLLGQRPAALLREHRHQLPGRQAFRARRRSRSPGQTMSPAAAAGDNDAWMAPVS